MKHSKLYTALICLCVFMNCSKEKVYHSAIIISILDGNQVVPNAPLYMKRGVAASAVEHDQTMLSNSQGQVTFSNLPTDNYYFYSVSGTKTGSLMINVQSQSGNRQYYQGTAYSGRINLN